MGRGMRRLPGGREGPALSAEARALDLIRRARGLARLLWEQTGLQPEQAVLLETVLRIPADPARDVEMAGRLVESLASALRILGRNRAAGAGVRCYRCESDRCPHSRPGDPLHVFAGYDPMGRPRWIDLLSFCLERREERTETLLSGGGRVVAVVESGHALHGEQLAAFGASDPAYRILGQVAAGPFPPAGPGGAAATFLVVRLGVVGLDSRLRLEVICQREELVRENPALADILREARKTLELLSLRLEGLARTGVEEQPEQAVLPFLRALGRDLEAHARATQRRTGHALIRVRQSMRPTEMAFPDARTAADERLLVDGREGTLVVLGPRNRVHIFTPEGRHITSLRLRGDAIATRRRTGRWRQAEAEERGDFRRGLRLPSLAGEGPVTGTLSGPGLTDPGS